MKVIVYSSPTCPQCRILKNKLQGLGVAFEEKDVNTDFEALAFVTSLAPASLPVVKIDEDVDFYDVERIISKIKDKMPKV